VEGHGLTQSLIGPPSAARSGGRHTASKDQIGSAPLHARVSMCTRVRQGGRVLVLPKREWSPMSWPVTSHRREHCQTPRWSDHGNSHTRLGPQKSAWPKVAQGHRRHSSLREPCVAVPAYSDSNSGRKYRAEYQNLRWLVGTCRGWHAAYARMRAAPRPAREKLGFARLAVHYWAVERRLSIPCSDTPRQLQGTRS